MNLLEILMESVFLFAVIGLPFLTRYAPYIRGPHDVSDPVADPLRHAGETEEPEETKNAKRSLLWRRTFQVYGVSLLVVILFHLIYQWVA